MQLQLRYFPNVTSPILAVNKYQENECNKSYLGIMFATKRPLEVMDVDVLLVQILMESPLNVKIDGSDVFRVNKLNFYPLSIYTCANCKGALGSWYLVR